jgi:asparaginyl-tRNA synthetase
MGSVCKVNTNDTWSKNIPPMECFANYPKRYQAFYMRQGEWKNSCCEDLAPGIGECKLQKEERLDKLQERMKQMHIPAEEQLVSGYKIRHGTRMVAGLGFKKMVLCYRMSNIRDV